MRTDASADDDAGVFDAEPAPTVDAATVLEASRPFDAVTPIDMGPPAPGDAGPAPEDLGPGDAWIAGDPVSPAGLGFDLQLRFDRFRRPPDVPIPWDRRLTAFFEDSPERNVVSGTLGEVGRSTYVIDGPGVVRWTVDLTYLTTGDCLLLTPFHADITARFVDTDGDGRADVVQGQATGRLDGFISDIGETWRFEATITGVRDVTAPSVTTGVGIPRLLPATALHPFDGPTILASSEPLAAGPAFALVGNERWPLTPRFGHPGPWAQGGLATPRALPFDSTVRFEGLVDLSGHPAGAVAIPTLPAPPLSEQNGFEGTVSVRLEDGAAIVGGLGNVRPISGASSLYVPSFDLYRRTFGGRAILRLARAPGTTQLVLRFRHVYAVAWGWSVDVTVGAPGGAAVPPVNLAATGPREPVERTGMLPYDRVGPVSEVRIDLPPGDEMVVEIRTAVHCIPAPLEYGTGVLVDDLRLE